MNWHSQPMHDGFVTPQAAMVKVRLLNKLHVSINGRDIYYRPAGFVMELPEYEATMMIRNRSAELVTDTLLPHLFAKKKPPSL
jgi:hypothetical protein